MCTGTVDKELKFSLVECLWLYALAVLPVKVVVIHLQVRCVWPISGGLLLERQISADWGYDGLPTLFTLLHPMDDFCPVTCKRPAASM